MISKLDTALQKFLETLKNISPKDSFKEPEGYVEGFIDGKKAGFEEAIAWIKGKQNSL